MCKKLFINLSVLLFFLLAFPLSGVSEEVIDEKLLDQTVKDITAYTELIDQIKSEKKLSKGTEVTALSKQLELTRKAYHGLLWGFVDDLGKLENKEILSKYAQFASSHLLDESKVLRKDIEKNLAGADVLEDKIISGKSDFTIGGQEKLSSFKSKLSKKRKKQEKLYSSLVKNIQKTAKLENDSTPNFSYIKPLVNKQANMLSGLIGIDKDTLTKFEKKLSVVSNESKPGQKLLFSIRNQNMLIQNDVERLQSMIDLLKVMEVDVSLHKKTVVQSKSGFSSDMLDTKVASHLFTEYWLETKKWFSKKAPELFGKTVTFLAIILFAYFIASLVKRMIRRIFKRTLPDMSELAKSFIVSMSAKLVLLVGLLLALSNLGIQIGPLLAGLGIMGFIVGFALQDTLSNFASGLMILIYRPYDVGDKIKSAGVKGKVSKMNLVSTTVFTSENSQLTVPNKKIWGDIIDNITSHPLHRIDLFFSTPYNSDSEGALAAITDVVDSCSSVEHDKKKIVRIHELGSAEVTYLARFWATTDNLKEARWTIFEGVKKRFDKEGISLEINDAADD